MKRDLEQGIVEVAGLAIKVYFTLDGTRGVLIADEPAGAFDLLAHGGEAAELRPGKGEPISIYLMGGKMDAVGYGPSGAVAFMLHTGD